MNSNRLKTACGALLLSAIAYPLTSAAQSSVTQIPLADKKSP